jgi:hypothetical protein
VDFIRTRAVPPLIACLIPIAAAAADCSSLNGTYRDEEASPVGAERHYLSDLTMERGRAKLFQVESRGTAPGGLSPTAPMQRPRISRLASSATLTYAPKKTRLRFLDARGAVLAELGIDSMDPWTCKDGRLVRNAQRASGLGDTVRTERIEETLERNAAGDLVHRQTRTVIDGAAGKPSVFEAHFPTAR